ncbi:hypothetical protein [Pseudomonas simiae]
MSRAPAAPPADLFTRHGGLGYMQFCSDCHLNAGTVETGRCA